MGIIVQSLTAAGLMVEIECRLSNNLPNIVIVGSANKAVDESRERIRGAFSTSHIMLPRKRITVNLAPADLPKADSGFDLAIAVAILAANGQLVTPVSQHQAFIGELGLDGSTRAVRGIIGRLLAGRAKGISTFYIPAANLQQAQLVPHVKLIPLKGLAELYTHLTGLVRLRPLSTGPGRYITESAAPASGDTRLSDVIGQDQAKRALEIAAAGGHNLLLSGPPGTGKTMLAKAVPGLLPPLDHEELLEVTQLHSLVNQDYQRIISRRPFRAPHHSASYVAFTGGGTRLRPGEISLAHRGVLFLDELPEFGHQSLEALRQPLEDRVISLARAPATTQYPANFILLATANPCPCGYYGVSGGKCRCTDYQIKRYQHRLSGPILDRIDLYCSVHEVQHDKLLRRPADPESNQAVRQRIQQSRRRQAERYASSGKLNADMTNADIRRYGRLGTEAQAVLNTAARRLNISARAYMRTVKVARTIADLDRSEAISTNHISEALTYRAFLRSS
jgi:magnesium chelatase family protein